MSLASLRPSRPLLVESLLFLVGWKGIVVSGALGNVIPGIVLNPFNVIKGTSSFLSPSSPFSSFIHSFSAIHGDAPVTDNRGDCQGDCEGRGLPRL